MRLASKLSILLSVVLAAACGGSSSEPVTPTSAETPTEAPPPTEPAPAEPAAPAVPDEVAVAASAEHKAIVEAKDRTKEDRALDAGRKPAELLTFAGVKPGMKVAELGAASGYTTELLARAVSPGGAVYGQNNKAFLGFVGKEWKARLKRKAARNIVSVEREMEEPLPPEAKDLDAVFLVLLYHDLAWIGTDRDKMNKAVFDALKPGGIYVVVDHSGRPGTGLTEAKTIHRMEESLVAPEVEKAGFKLAERASFLRNPDDTRDWDASPMNTAKRGTSDRFVLKFVKP